MPAHKRHGSHASMAMPPVKRFKEERAEQQKDSKQSEASLHSNCESFPQFMKLRLELRREIYFYAMGAGKPRELTDLLAPTLTLVSKRIRSEAMRVFMSQCAIAVDVNSNYLQTKELDYIFVTRLDRFPMKTSTRFSLERSHRAGEIEPLSEQTEDWLKWERGAKTMYFQNIQMRIVDEDGSPKEKPALWLRTRNGDVDFERESHPHTAYLKDLDRLRGRAEKAAGISRGRRKHTMASRFASWNGLLRHLLIGRTRLSAKDGSLRVKYREALLR